jgi:hypothetical protein
VPDTPPDRLARCDHNEQHRTAHRFEPGLAFGAFAGQVGLGLVVASGAGECDAVDGGVELTVAAAVEPVSMGVAGADRDGGDAGGARELGCDRQALDMAFGLRFATP